MPNSYADLKLNIDDAGKADLDAAISGLLDRYVAIVKDLPDCKAPGDAIQFAVALVTNDVGFEAKKRLASLNMPTERRLVDIMGLAQKMAGVSGFMLAGLPHLLQILAYGQLSQALRDGLTASTTHSSRKTQP